MALRDGIVKCIFWEGGNEVAWQFTHPVTIYQLLLQNHGQIPHCSEMLHVNCQACPECPSNPFLILPVPTTHPHVNVEPGTWHERINR